MELEVNLFYKVFSWLHCD